MTFAQVVTNVVTDINTFVIPLLVSLAVIFFLINILRYFFIESGEEAKQKGQQAILFGLIGIAVIFSLWGLINLFVGTLNLAAGISSS